MKIKTTLIVLLISAASFAQVIPTVHNDLSDGNTYDGYTDMDIYNNALYISNSDAGEILKVDVSSPNTVPSVFLGGLDFPTGIKVLGDELYFFEAADEDFSPSSGRLWKINLLNAGATPVLVIGSLSYPLQLDIANAQVYFVETFYVDDDFDHSVVSRVNLTGAATKTTITGQRGSVDDIEISGNALYMVEFNMTLEAINIFKMDISTLTPPAPDLFYADPGFAPYNLEISGSKMYFNADDDDVPVVYQLDLLAPNPVASAVAGPFVFNGGGTYVGEIVITASNIMYAFGDSWNGTQSYLIYRADLNTLSVDKNSKLSITAYPNPVFDYLVISGIEVTASYQILDLSGKKVGSGVVSAADRIDVRKLQSGIYLVNTEGAGPIKFVKQ